MKRRKILGLIIGILSLCVLIVSTGGIVQASKVTTPKGMRGTWYEYFDYAHSYSVIKIKAHSVITYNQNKRGHRTFAHTFLPGKKGQYKLRIIKHKKGWMGYGTKGIGGSVYQFNKAIDDAHTLPMMWIGHRKINGKVYRVLKTYQNQGAFHVLTKQKMTHDNYYRHTGKYFMTQIGK